jgi:hypothetical protein
MEDNFKILAKEDVINILKMKYALNIWANGKQTHFFFLNGRQPQFWQIDDDLILFGK